MSEIQFGYLDLKTNNQIYKALCNMLPSQGCIEFQKDEPYKEHKWHRHENSETLLIIEGSLILYYREGEKKCYRGDYIHLPKLVEHASKASETGVVYVIAFEIITFAECYLE